MTDDTSTQTTPTTPQPDPQGGGDAPASSGATAPSGEAKTFTEAEVNAMIAARISKHERALRKTWEEQQADEKRKAQQTAEERAAEAERKATEAIERANAQVRAANQRAALAGKVRDLDYAIFKLGQKPDEFTDDDGNVNAEAFLKAYPDLVLAQSGPAPIKPGGKPGADKPDMNTLIRTAIQRRTG
jgi:hypothetical protein